MWTVGDGDGFDGPPCSRPRSPSFGMLWSKRQDDFREFENIAPAAAVRGFVELSEPFAEIALFLGQSMTKLLQGSRRAEQKSLHPIDGLKGRPEVALLRLLLRRQPVAGCLFEKLKFRVAN